MELHDERAKLICIVQEMINADNELITKIQDTNREREQLLLKLLVYGGAEKKHGPFCVPCGELHKHDYFQIRIYDTTVPILSQTFKKEYNLHKANEQFAEAIFNKREEIETNYNPETHHLFESPIERRTDDIEYQLTKRIGVVPIISSGITFTQEDRFK